MHAADIILGALILAAGGMHGGELCAALVLLIAITQNAVATQSSTDGATTYETGLRAPLAAEVPRLSTRFRPETRGTEAHPPSRQLGRFMAAAALDFERDTKKVDVHLVPRLTKRHTAPGEQAASSV